MCVLIVKPAGKAMPTYDILKMAFNANPDGCGFVSPTHHFKTLDFDKFITHLARVKREDPCIIHFRFATHGSIGKHNCHPFYNADTDTWFAHNGILNIVPVGDMTDSETAFQFLFAPIIAKHGIDSDELKYKVWQIIGASKFAFLKNREILTFGEFIEYHGCQFSNLRFMPYGSHIRHAFCTYNAI